jgi:hypothetical protein
MEKLKKAKVTVTICTPCKGNGYLKVGTESGETVHQCWDCDSEGEFYEVNDMGWVDDGTSDSLH